MTLNLRLIYLFLAFLSFSAFSQNASLSTTEFLDDPFGFELTISNFLSCESPKYKLQKSVFKKHPTDTIYKFYKGKNELFFNKASDIEAFFAGIIRNKKIKLNGGIHVGMEKEDFLAVFSDLNGFEGTVYKLTRDGYPLNFTFVFKRDKLQVVKIDNK